MDVYRPKKDPRPCRRKDKDNPYEIFSVGIDTDTSSTGFARMNTTIQTANPVNISICFGNSPNGTTGGIDDEKEK